MAYRQQGYSDEPGYGGNQYSNSYGGNPYAQAGNPYSSEAPNPYAAGQYDARPAVQHQSSSRYADERTQGGYEMNEIRDNDPDWILEQIRHRVTPELASLQSQLRSYSGLLESYRSATETQRQSALAKAVDTQTEDFMRQSRALNDLMKRIKSRPEAGNSRYAPQIRTNSRSIQEVITEFQKLERQHVANLREQQRRQYLITRPDATEAEVQEAVESGNQQIFSQALMTSDRRGQANQTLTDVRSRHEAIQKISRDMEELSKMFQDLETLVIQQEAQVVQIDQQGEVVKENANQGNVQLAQAVDKARAARKKKWICLGIAVLIVIIIIVVVVVAVLVTRKN